MSQHISINCTSEWIFQRYEEVRGRLPEAVFPPVPRYVGSLGALSEQFDVFLFDSFGVLNVGEQPIAGARERLLDLRRRGKRVAVLTNAATGPLAGLVEKYRKLGFGFERREIISSRELLATAVAQFDPTMTWGIAAPPASEVDEFGLKAILLDPDDGSVSRADGFILLSSQTWSPELQACLTIALCDRPRQLLVGNPDLAAPREAGFSVEPGTYAHEIAENCNVEPTFYGKPFANAFEEAVARFGEDVPRGRIAMVGDTLHTDILGGAAAGLATILVTDNGVLRDLDLQQCLDASGIVPDYVVPHI
ncbi:MAG: HAD-IIA family hydrolase [Hyphomicrobiaceae bacterium]